MMFDGVSGNGMSSWYPDMQRKHTFVSHPNFELHYGKIVQEGGSWYGKNCFVQDVNLIYVTGQQRCISTYLVSITCITVHGGS